MRIILTGGGTAGHVTPHLSLIPKLKKRGYEIHYLGTREGIEHSMMEAVPGVSYHCIKSGKLRRYRDIKNLTDPFRVAEGWAQSLRLIRHIRPDVIFSKGGFVSVPVVLAAHLCQVPVVCHESDLTPGLANRICARYADKVAASFPECAKALGSKGVYTGTPLRPELFQGSRERGLKRFGLEGKKPVLLMTGGSLGAQSINECLRKALPQILPMMEVLHLCGKGNLDESLRETPGYHQLEFLSDEMPDAYAVADLVLSRAGSNAIFELLALRKPMLLIPYPKGASRGDQIENAASYEKQGFAHVLQQEDMTPESLSAALVLLARDQDSLKAYMEKSPVRDGTAAVLRLIEDARQKRQKKNTRGASSGRR